ncbi:MAG: hypothetical protein Q9M82_01250 [Mariprofundus sp.]|nr:hypothetical protein [Mariprofundus sp.]
MNRRAAFSALINQMTGPFRNLYSRMVNDLLMPTIFPNLANFGTLGPAGTAYLDFRELGPVVLKVVNGTRGGASIR